MTITRNQKIGTAIASGVALTASSEGIRQFAYYDPPGILTVCYGSTTDVQPGRRYSLAECRQRLEIFFNQPWVIEKRQHDGRFAQGGM